MREDYDKLLAMKDSVSKTGYKLSSILDEGHPYAFAKYYDASKTYIEYRHFPCVIGPFVDLFPLDECNESSVEITEKLNLAEWKYRKSIAVHSWNEIWSDIKVLNIPDACAKIVKKIIYAPNKNKYKNDILTIESELKDIKGDYLRPYYNAAYKSIMFPKLWFEKSISVSFEDTKIRIPIEYDAFLKYTYNDYMTLPPKEKRVGGHAGFFVDLSSRKTYKDALEAKPYNPSKRLGLHVIIDEFKNRKGFTKK